MIFLKWHKYSTYYLVADVCIPLKFGLEAITFVKTWKVEFHYTIPTPNIIEIKKLSLCYIQPNPLNPHVLLCSLILFGGIVCSLIATIYKKQKIRSLFAH